MALMATIIFITIGMEVLRKGIAWRPSLSISTTITPEAERIFLGLSSQLIRDGVVSFYAQVMKTMRSTRA